MKAHQTLKCVIAVIAVVVQMHAGRDAVVHASSCVQCLYRDGCVNICDCSCSLGSEYTVYFNSPACSDDGSPSTTGCNDFSVTPPLYGTVNCGTEACSGGGGGGGDNGECWSDYDCPEDWV